MATTRVRSLNSLERWRSALQRAINNGLEVFVLAGDDSGFRYVTSASHLDRLYRTDGKTCGCEAAAADDPVCMHRAAYWFVMGPLTLPEPAQPTVNCPSCSGCGVCYSRSGGWKCPECGGTGRVPDNRPQDVPVVVLAGQPSVEIAA